MVVDARPEKGQLDAGVGVAAGELLEVNERVVDAPETVNEDPYGEGWLVRIRLSDPSEVDVLLDAATYKQQVDDLA